MEVVVEVVVVDLPIVVAGTGLGPLQSVPTVLMLCALAPLCSVVLLVGAWLGAVGAVLACAASHMAVRHLVHVSGLAEPCGQCEGRWLQ